MITLHVEPIAEKYAQALFQLIENSREHLGAWLPWVPGMITQQQFDSFVQYAVQRNAAKEEYSCVVLSGNTVAGRIGLYHWDARNHSASLGYWLGREFEGRGYMTAASQIIIDKGFSSMGLNRIELRCGTGNTRSGAVAERLGFRLEGVARQAEKLNGRFIDLNVYSLLKSEWENRL